MSHVRMSHVPRTNESCPTYESAISCVYMQRNVERVRHCVFVQVLLRTNEAVTSHVSVSHVPHTNEPCPTYEWVLSHMYICDTTQSASDTASLSRSSCARANQSRPKYEWVMSHIRMSHVPHTNESCRTYEWVVSHTYIGHNVECVRHCIFVRVLLCTGRWVGSLKLQVSFAKEPYKRDDILQKRPILSRSLLIVATP